MTRILFVVTALGTGGAEIMLCKLLQRLDRSRFDPCVVSLADRGTVGPRIESLGVPIVCAGLGSGAPSARRLASVAAFVRRWRPDVLQGWMYHGNVAAWMLRASCPGRPALAWGIRQTLYDLAAEKSGTARIIRIGARLSSRVDRVVYNSKVAARQHTQLGYAAARAEVIPNGFDTGSFGPDASARAGLRKALGLPEDTVLVGLFARYHPMKDHANFMRAAADVHASYPAVHFVLAGRNVDRTNPALAGLAEKYDVAHRMHMLGERDDMAALAAAIDVAVSASAWGEAFSNSIGEAMAAGVPCVVTDIGDSGEIVGDTGRVVAPCDAAGLAAALCELVALTAGQRASLGAAARARVVERYSIDGVAARYQGLWGDLAG